MKKYLPFVIIVAVALLTIGIATSFYRAKTRPPAKVAASVKAPTPADEKEDKSLHVRGARNAPVTVEIYGDFQCPPCGFASRALDELEKQYAGKLRVIYHEFPLAMHNHAMEAAMAAEAAGLQSKFWEMHDLLYQYQPVWSKVSDAGYFFETYAGEIGLNAEQFRADRKSEEIRARIVAESEAGTTRGVKNTPTLFINGSEVQTGFTKEKLQETIATALAAKKSS